MSLSESDPFYPQLPNPCGAPPRAVQSPAVRGERGKRRGRRGRRRRARARGARRVHALARAAAAPRASSHAARELLGAAVDWELHALTR